MRFALATLALLVGIATSGEVQAKSLRDLIVSHGNSGFGFTWSRGEGVWLRPDGRGLWVHRHRGQMYRRHEDTWSFHADGRICTARTHFADPEDGVIRTCLSYDGTRCALERVSGDRYRQKEVDCTLITAKHARWGDYTYEARPRQDEHCCGGPLPPSRP